MSPFCRLWEGNMYTLRNDKNDIVTTNNEKLKISLEILGYKLVAPEKTKSSTKRGKKNESEN